MDIKQTIMRMLLFNKWLCKSESAKRTSNSLAKLKRYLAISITFAELVNAVFMIGFSLVFIYHKTLNAAGLDLPSYEVFNQISVWYFVAFLALGVLQVASMLIPSLRAVKSSGLCMIASSVVWGVVTAAYYESQNGMVTPAIVIIGFWAIAVFFMGNKIIKRAMLKERVVDEET